MASSGMTITLALEWRFSASFQLGFDVQLNATLLHYTLIFSYYDFYCSGEHSQMQFDSSKLMTW